MAKKKLVLKKAPIKKTSKKKAPKKTSKKSTQPRNKNMIDLDNVKRVIDTDTKLKVLELEDKLETLTKQQTNFQTQILTQIQQIKNSGNGEQALFDTAKEAMKDIFDSNFERYKKSGSTGMLGLLKVLKSYFKF